MGEDWNRWHTEASGDGARNLFQRALCVAHGDDVLVLGRVVGDVLDHLGEVAHMNGRQHVLSVPKDGQHGRVLPGHLEERVEDLFARTERQTRGHHKGLQLVFVLQRRDTRPPFCLIFAKYFYSRHTKLTTYTHTKSNRLLCSDQGELCNESG